MSIDNGVYILYTESQKGPEYRVAYSHAIANVYGKWNVDTAVYEGDIDALKSVFKDAPVFYSLNEAVDKAEDIAYDHPYLEDGVCVINDFASLGYIFE